jgi:hypothetical protein
MRTGRPIAPLSLAVEERERLKDWARRPKTARALAQRARIVLECASGAANTAVARKLGVTHQTVGKCRQRFFERRLDGLLDEPRPGAPRQVSDAQVDGVVRMTLESAPADATHSSTRTMAKRCGLSQSMVSRIWRAFALQPHRVEGFKLSKDPLFIEKLRDIVGLYLNPPDRALVLCVDEKSQIQALDRSQPVLPMRPGQSRAPHARLSAPWHHQPVRCARLQGRYGNWRVASAAPGDRVSQVPRDHRPNRADRARSASDHRQLRHPQDPGDQTLAPAPSALSPALHPYRRVLAQSGGALACGPHRKATSARRASQHPRTGGRHPPLSRPQQPSSRT